jgi:AcrR family transcriptional regulator
MSSSIIIFLGGLMLKSTEEKRKIKKAEVANSIIEAATPMIHDRSFTQISIQEFCEIIGITTGMFYRHFKTKNDILAVVYDRESKQALAELTKRVRDLPLAEQLIELGMTLCSCSQMLGPDGLLMYLHTEKGGYDCEASRNDLEQAVQSIVENSAKNGELLPCGRTAKAISDDIVILLKGITFEWYSWRDSFDIETRTKDLLERFIPTIIGSN